MVFINALLEHLACTGQALGISHGIEETKQFNNVAFMDDITALAQGNAGGQVLLDATQEFETWSNMRLNLNKTVVVEPSATGQKFSNGSHQTKGAGFKNRIHLCLFITAVPAVIW